MCPTFVTFVAACAIAESSVGMPDKLLDKYAFPKLVQAMLKWPDKETLESKQRVRPEEGSRFRPLNHSLDWINRLLDPNWLPPTSVRDEMIFIRQEYGKLSASHVRWQKKGYTIQVTQSRAIIAIKLKPISLRPRPTTQTELETYARDVCMDLFTDAFQSNIQLNPQMTDERLRIKDIRSKIAEHSFECGLKRPVAGGLAGTAWKREFFPPEAKAPSQPSSLMWWHYLGWYTNGETVAFWTFKVEGDSWYIPPACVADPIGDKWF